MTKTFYSFNACFIFWDIWPANPRLSLATVSGLDQPQASNEAYQLACFLRTSAHLTLVGSVDADCYANKVRLKYPPGALLWLETHWDRDRFEDAQLVA